MKKLLFFVLILTLPIAASAADSFSTLEERMSGKEFMETGLGKLTDEELQALNEWVRSHSVATLEDARPAAVAGATGAAMGADMRGFENKKDKDSNSDATIYSSIPGTFVGWSGDTIFRLSNGMIWKQVASGSLGMRPTENVSVTIKSGFMGAWHLKVEGRNESVRVERIQ